MCDDIRNLVVSNNDIIGADVGSHNFHLYMRRINKEKNVIDKEISMHLSLEKVEDLIKGLKRKLKLCYESKVEEL
jgi:hypothetical protein